MASLSPIWVKISDFGISKQSLGTSLRTAGGTLCYQAPELLGLLPRDMRTSLRDSYTKLVDIWALGAVAHEILTSEIPFLERYQDTDLMITSGLLTACGSEPCSSEPAIDTEVLYNFCRGAEFPSVSLREKGVSEGAINFVKCLMVANPHDRVSATDALKHEWFTGPQLIRSQFQLLAVYLSPESADRLFEEDNQASIMDILHFSGASDIWAMQSTAVSMGYLSVVKILLSVIDDIDAGSLLQLAARAGQVEVIKLLLDSGAGINASTSGLNGETALHAAASNGHLVAMELLLKRGANVNNGAQNKNGQQPLHAAAAGGHLDAIKLLLERGAYVNGVAVSENSQTALHGAARSGHLDAIKILLENGADVNSTSVSQNGQSALHAAAEGGHLEAMKLLLDSGARINSASGSQSGQSALHAATASGHLNAMILLLMNGADVNLAPVTPNGQSALHAAAASGNLEGLRLLLECGAGVNAAAHSQNGQTALHAAAGSGHLGAVRLLLEWGADVNYVPPSLNGQSALHAAAMSGHLEVTMFLLSRGAHVSHLALSMVQDPAISTLLHGHQRI